MSGQVIDMTGKLMLAQLLEHISDGDSVLVTATGRSMMPTFIPDKDRILLSPVKAEDIRVGDVVFFNRGDSVCVHRVIFRDGDRLVIRGDGNGLKALEPAKVSAVFAKVTGGTMRGREFNIDNKRWNRNTRFVMRCFPAIALWHRISRVLRCYPLSMLVVAVLMYLSFFKPPKPIVETPIPLDKIVHVIMYLGVSSVFWFEWFMSHRGRSPRVRRGMLFCLLLPVLMGGLIEIGQSVLTSYRGGDWYDVLANCIGVMLATAFSLLVTKPVIRNHFTKTR